MPRRRNTVRQKISLSEEEFDDDDSREKPQQRNAANARERARMRVLSRAFCRLKTTLPWVPPDTKLSKLDTLRLATSYIAHLRAVLCLDDDDEEDQTRIPNTIHPLNLTWPFSFQQPTGAMNNNPRSPEAPWEVSPHRHKTELSLPHIRHHRENSVSPCSPLSEDMPLHFQLSGYQTQNYSDSLLQIG
uniref:BHLH domain-containing protein n=1 Tax=Clastoptera arizonana TaxID=38151 RepID=A0A1B6CMV8_9HEMI